MRLKLQLLLFTLLKCLEKMDLQVCFFQKYWHIIGTDVCNAVQQFFTTWIMDRRMNHNIISLIPKVKQVRTMSDLRPIGLCKVLYKIISKVLTTHLQPFMDSLIGKEHSAFTKNRLISDNILINHEVMHSLKLRRKYKNYGMVVKLDVSKAYECVEWPYLEHMLRCFEFHETWIWWIMACVTTISYSI